MRINNLILVTLFVSLLSILSSCQGDTHIASILHVNINCSDLEQSNRFYKMLGFTSVMKVNSEVDAEFAAALDMPPYTLRYTQLIHRDGSLIDLIEWKDPYDPSTPYSDLNHLGIARITLLTTDLEADIGLLSSQGVEFFSEPVNIDRPTGNERFVCFKDPDGTIIQLVETDAAGGNTESGINITGFLRTNINCSDFEQSRVFYEMLGFKSVMDFEEEGTPEIAAALGMPSYQVIGSFMKLRYGPAINLMEWTEPYDSSSPYPHLNHLGIARIALLTTNLDAAVSRLSDQGVEFFSEPATPDGPLGFMRIVCFKDPDGTVIELVQIGPNLSW